MTLGEFRNFTKDIDDDAEIYFDTPEFELPLWYLSHRKRRGLQGLPDLVVLHDKNSIDLQEEVRSACRYLGKDAAFQYLEDHGLTKKEIEEWLSKI